MHRSTRDPLRHHDLVAGLKSLAREEANIRVCILIHFHKAWPDRLLHHLGTDKHSRAQFIYLLSNTVLYSLQLMHFVTYTQLEAKNTQEMCSALVHADLPERTGGGQRRPTARSTTLQELQSLICHAN